MYQAFKGAAFVTCHRHVKENAVHKFDSVVGKRSATRRTIYDAAIRWKRSVVVWWRHQFRRCCRPSPSAAACCWAAEFAQHFERNLLPLLRANVVAGRARWMNNNCESINHVLQQYTQWKPHQVPELIAVLHELVTTQYVEADRAICGLYELMLTPDYAKHRITADCWKHMTADQRRKASDKCFRQMPCPSTTDGIVQVPMTSVGGKKPHSASSSTRSQPQSPRSKRVAIDSDDDDFEWLFNLWRLLTEYWLCAFFCFQWLAFL